MDYSNIDYDSTFDIIGLPENYINKYENLRIQNNIKAAFLCLFHAIKAFPSNYEISSKLFNFLYEFKEYKDLIKFSSFVLVNIQNQVRIQQCYGNIGIGNYFLNNYKEALENFVKAKGSSGICTEMPVTYYQAICYEKYGKYEKALELLTELYNNYSNTIMEVDELNRNSRGFETHSHCIKNETMTMITEAMNRVRSLLNKDVVYEITI